MTNTSAQALMQAIEDIKRGNDDLRINKYHGNALVVRSLIAANELLDSVVLLARQLDAEQAQPVAWAWRRDPAAGWALGHLEPTQESLHLLDKPEEWAKVEVRRLGFMSTGTLPPIARDEDYQRDYIPLPGGWEIQTKGRGSSFRICDTKSGERFNIAGTHFEHDFIERMAREIRVAMGASA
jgi:hypothetical protein